MPTFGCYFSNMLANLGRASKANMIHVSASQSVASASTAVNQRNDPMRQPSFLINLHSQLC